MKLKYRIKYHQIVKKAKTGAFSLEQKRFRKKITNGLLFYYPDSGKIKTTTKGVVFSNKDTCWYSLEELNELLNDMTVLPDSSSRKYLIIFQIITLLFALFVIITYFW
jgi:hypothetical protein